MYTGDPISTQHGRHHQRYLQYARTVLSGYNGTGPFHLYLRKYFSSNRKHGSRDRKQITSICYQYFRMGRAISPSVPGERQLLLAIFLMENTPSPLLEDLMPQWNEHIRDALPVKLEMVKDIFSLEHLLDCRSQLSDEINFPLFALSFLSQPRLFIRIRPGSVETVLNKIQSAGMHFEKMNEECLSFSNLEKVSEVIVPDKEAVIQDYNSQRTGELMWLLPRHPGSPVLTWDCCAASGGKSILAFDILKNLQLTVSDTRKTILKNLRQRLSTAGIHPFRVFDADLTSPSSIRDSIGAESFDFIIADVPCSGSGTWSRTPEQLHFFTQERIREYADLQRKIVSNAAAHLRGNGYLLYITCSVFKMENEENADFIEKNLDCTLVLKQYLKGYEIQADTLFAALFKKKGHAHPDRASGFTEPSL